MDAVVSAFVLAVVFLVKRLWLVVKSLAGILTSRAVQMGFDHNPVRYLEPFFRGAILAVILAGDLLASDLTVFLLYMWLRK
jgi:hypothetical protein